MKELLKSGSSFDVGFLRCLRVRKSHKVQQAMQWQRRFSRMTHSPCSNRQSSHVKIKPCLTSTNAWMA
eukprot:9136035-Ditylum_brightwellii.AAC.1